MSQHFDAREKLMRAVFLYSAAEKADEDSPYYDAELELREEELVKATREFLEASK
jgi:hypothetical protein